MTQEWRKFTKELLDRILATKLQFAYSRECKWGENKREETDCPPLSSPWCGSTSFIQLLHYNFRLRGQASESSTHMLPGILSTTLKFPGREPDHPLPSSANFKKNENFSVRLLVLRRQNFTLGSVYNGIIFFTVQGFRSLLGRCHFLLTRKKCTSTFSAQATICIDFILNLTTT